MKATPIVVVLVVAGASVAIAQSPVRAGRWEITMQMQMPNAPAQMPEMKSIQCVTPEQAKDPARALARGLDGRDQKQDCKVSDYKVSGNKVTWQMACTMPQPMTSTGEVTFTDDSYAGTMKMTMAQGDMAMKIAGKRLGDCTQ